MLALLLAGCGRSAPPPDAPDPAPPPLPAAPPALAPDIDPTCPPGMIGIQTGPAELGEADGALAAKYTPNTVVPRSVYSVPAFCIDRYPLPGRQGDAWPTDGLNKKQVREQVEPWLHRHDRRLCTVAELMRAAGGPLGQRYPWGDDPSAEICDIKDDAPDAMGTFAGCVSPDGLRDLQVRSTWARLDPQTLERMTAAGAADQPGFDGGYAVWGGLVRTDTYYAPTNFGVHFHQDSAPGFSDDGLRTCAWPSAGAHPDWAGAMDRLRERKRLAGLGR